ncbi:MAG TPA: bifunctional adenosylcobinamide kinase/adenosylcobinamide-phosphate guanylyltransferase [Allocoleopsis sp.]
MITLVTGPARSGKSEWAEILAQNSQKPVIYIATAMIDPDDLDWQNRIIKHQQRRCTEWQTLEVPINLAETLPEYPDTMCLLIDSLGTWVTNMLYQDDMLWESNMQTFLTSLSNCAADVILVGEETGWGVVPSYPIGRTFRDRLGTLTRKIAQISDIVYLVSTGYVLNLTQLGVLLPPS